MNASWRRTFRLVRAIGGLATVLMTAPSMAADDDLVVFAAASLRNALDDINTAWAGEGDRRATISYAASSALARQIEHGAPADVFISANASWMDYLSQRELTRKDSETPLLGNRLVLIAPAASATAATIAPGFDIAGLLGDGKLAMANTDAVPAGIYGKAALTSLGVWDAVSAQVAQADNVRAALSLVARGEAPLGIVYETDAAADDGVRVLDRFPKDTHDPIVYPAAVLAESRHADAPDFLRYLQGGRARALFEAHGFTVIAPRLSN